MKKIILKRIMAAVTSACVLAGAFPAYGVMAMNEVRSETNDINIGDVINIGDEIFVCYDSFEKKSKNEELAEKYGRFLKLSDKYRCLWQEGMDYSNGVRISEFGEIPEYGEPTGMEASDPDLVADLACLEYGIEDDEGEYMAPRFYVDGLLFSDPEKLNGEYAWLSELILDTVAEEDDIGIFYGSKLKSGTEKQTWTGYLEGGSDSAVDNTGTYMMDIRYTNYSSYPCGFHELLYLNNNNGKYASENYYAYGPDGKIAGGPKNQFSTAEYLANNAKAKAYFEAYKPYSSSNTGGYRIWEYSETPLEWHIGKKAYNKTKTVELTDYSWSYSSNLGIRYDKTAGCWVDDSGTQATGTYIAGGTTDGGVKAVGGSAGILGETGKPVYSIKNYNGATCYSTKKVLPWTFKHVNYYDGSGNKNIVNTDEGEFTGWYVDASATITPGMPGTLDNVEEEYLFPSVDMKITDNNGRGDGLNLLANLTVNVPDNSGDPQDAGNEIPSGGAGDENVDIPSDKDGDEKADLSSGGSRSEESEIEALRRENARLSAENAALKAENASLKAQLASVSKTSSGSSSGTSAGTVSSGGSGGGGGGGSSSGSIAGAVVLKSGITSSGSSDGYKSRYLSLKTKYKKIKKANKKLKARVKDLKSRILRETAKVDD